MRRKTLIVVTLIAVMLLSSFLPIVSVYAAEEGTPTETEMTFNTDLYKGLKAYFQEQGISATYNDVEHTIDMSASVLNSIETISLKEKGISDISGIENFVNVKSLILSANELTENSNLSVLNGLTNLQYLDLSSNSIKDVSEIETLIMRLLSIDSNAVNLSSQTSKIVVDVETDSTEEKLTEEFELPQILQMAGIANSGSIENQGYLKADWFSVDRTGSNANGTDPLDIAAKAPYILSSSIPNPVTAEDNKFKIQVGYEDASGNYTPYQGLVKLVITIKDIDPASYSLNPASENILKDSVFTLYFVVHLDYTDAIIIKDRNLYYAIKEQLEEGQLINPNLVSYKYGVDSDEEIDYDLCTYTLSGTTATLSVNGTKTYTISNFSINGGTGSVYNVITGKTYSLEYKVEDISTPDASGNITTKRYVKVPHINEDCRTLYVDAYDEPQAFVITDLDIVNKITSLILNDKRIYDLSGIEGFVGLESNLNVSYNYIDTLAYIYALQKNKESRNSSLQELFNEKKSAMATKKDKVTKAYDNAENAKKSIEEEIKKIQNTIQEYNDLSAEEKTDEKLESVKKSIQTSVTTINGDGTEDNPGLISEIETAFTDPQDGLNSNLSSLYSRLAAMYNIFNNEYKLTTILTPQMNYQTEEEYEAYKTANETLETAKSMAKTEISRIGTLEKAGALSELEKDLIVEAFGLALSDEQEYPISYAFNELVKDYEDLNVKRSVWVTMNNKFLEIGIYSSAANYCLLQRMNNDTASNSCYVAKYLDIILENYKYENIDTTLVEAIYEKAKNGTASDVYTSSLNDIFTTYIEKTLTYSGTTFYVCEGTYYEVDGLDSKFTGTATFEGITYPTGIEFIEEVNSKLSSSGIFFYEQLMSLANKFTAIDETGLYVNLPSLKRIDVRNNEIETLGDVELTMISSDGTEVTSTENLASLPNLKELYAGHNLVTGDIACVDWSSLTALKSLDLSYNFISDISPIQVLSNLRYLDVSDNLLDGAFNLQLRKMPKLKEAKFAGNKYENIDQIINDFEMVSGGDFTGYFAREDTLNLDLSRQNLEINIETPIVYEAGKVTAEVTLPRIFAQLEYIDATRTAFGTTSSKGSIQASGGVAYIPVNELGNYVATVTVIAANGYPEEVSTSVGINSTCTITYKVVAEGTYVPSTDDTNTKTVTAVTVSSSKSTVVKGSTLQMTATVTGTNLEDADKTVTWEVLGNASSNTTISNSGLLTVASDETARSFTVKAVSTLDNTVSGSKAITIVEEDSEDEPTYGYTISSDGTEVLGVSPNTTLSTFASNLISDTSYTVEVRRDGKAISASDYVATSDIVVISKDGEVVSTYELVVKGDVNGDGVADSLDSSAIKAHRAKITLLTGTFLEAADLNSDGEVTITDVRLLLYHRAKIEGYIL